MKVLYVSDLDGTLLHSDQKTSAFTNDMINRLIDSGVDFTYATARAYETAQLVTQGIHIKAPVILHNGSFILDTASGEMLLFNLLLNSKAIIDDLTACNIYPIVFWHNGSAEKFSFIPDKCSDGVRVFAQERINDPRYSPINSYDELDYNDIFYITCIDESQKLKPFYDKYKNDYHCEYQKNLYTKEQWLEIMPKSATKANAVLKLKELMGCDKVVCFGDDTNDIDMFKAADECYAVSNAVEELKDIADAVIQSNNDDAVAKWLCSRLNDNK